MSDTTVTISVTGSNDLPTVTLVTPTLDAGTTADASTIDENDEFSATVTIDEGGGRDENGQAVTGQPLYSGQFSMATNFRMVNKFD